MLNILIQFTLLIMHLKETQAKFKFNSTASLQMRFKTGYAYIDRLLNLLSDFRVAEYAANISEHLTIR